jgi:uncharacterized protein (DUF885 family)
MKRLLTGPLVALFMAAGAHAAPDPQETAALHALFDRQWEASARRYPEGATNRGDLRYNDRLTDQSPEAIAAWDAQTREFLREAQAIDADRLGDEDRLSRELFIDKQRRAIVLQPFAGYRSLELAALGGAQSSLAELMPAVPVRTAGQVQELLRRMAAYPRQMDQEIASMRRGIALGWVSPKNVLERVLAQIDVQLKAPIDETPYFGPFQRLGGDIPAGERDALQAAGRRAIQDSVLPALRRLRAFVAGDYFAAAPADGAFLHYPDGARVYGLLVADQTTTGLTPEQIHAIGQREVARLRGEMEAVMRGTGFQGTFAEFVHSLNTDPKFFAASPEALLTGYRDIAKRIDGRLPELFAELPRTPYGVRAMPAWQGPDAAEYYDPPARDGTRAGFFNANTTGWRTRPVWKMASLTAHEAVPGHHIQLARAAELKSLPQFRRGEDYTAFVEGWAVYAETLGREIGLYDDPYSLFGHLQWQSFRAARLVVDTGIHGLGWSRQQAIDFMAERTGMERGFVTSEVDRYTSYPGQALGYMIGKLKIAELRQHAQQRLGAKFDLRRFHNAVIDEGALPLDVLERVIERWIEKELAKPQ